MNELTGNGAPAAPADLATTDGPSISARIADEVAAAGNPWREDEVYAGSIGRTMFDLPNSQDHTVVVLMPAEEISRLPSQALVRIRSRSAAGGGDGRVYLGAVVAGPYAEPDGLRADAPIVVTTTVRGAQFLPRYHGRVQVEILAEEVDGATEPPRFRPLPNSPVFALSDEETRAHLGLVHDNPLHLGTALGYEKLAVVVPAHSKAVLPRHVAVLGTTGGGKSTTVSGLIAQFAAAGIATILIDTEGEYTTMGAPTQDPTMVRLLARAGHKPAGLSNLHVRYLVGSATTAPEDVPTSQFRLDFASLSPYAAVEIMELSDAQEERFFKAYDVARTALEIAGIFPRPESDDERARQATWDDTVDGYPRLTLYHLYDIVTGFLDTLNQREWQPKSTQFKPAAVRKAILDRIVEQKTSHPNSWNTLRNRLHALARLRIFDNPNAKALHFPHLLQAGATTVIDLSDTESSTINNLVIANLLAGVQRAQEEAYTTAERQGRAPVPVMIIIEEAHEFLSTDRIARMETLFGQVSRLARRGRKRWLGLVFVTQLPQHLPDEVLGLVNNFILHKISDNNVVSRLRHMVGGVDDGQWKRLPNLAPGQAIVSFTSMSRPLLVNIQPTPNRLRMVE